RFGDARQLIVENLVIGVFLLGVSALLVAITASHGASRRLGAGAAAGIGSFLPLLTLTMVTSQFGLASGRDAALSNWGILAAILGAIAIGTVAALLVPAPAPGYPAPPVPADTARLPHDDGSPLEWTASVVPTRGVMIGIIALLAPVTVLSVWMATSGMWVMLVVSLAVLLLVVAINFFHVRIDSEGLTARSMVSVPTFRVPLAEVVRADVREVRPFAEFGGWGYRTNGRETGIVTRTGPGVVVERSTGGAFVVTVDGAEEAARTLNTLAARRNHGPR
ncbi:MAG: hypothetical protein Q4G64_10010, partial [bacterium]|nr:hypothetical protein [bacterium]